MSQFIINGGNSLNGKVSISGSKNAALPIIAASLLTEDDVYISNIPDIKDVKIMLEILKLIGSKITFYTKNNIKINSSNIDSFYVPFSFTKKIRASILVLGPLLLRFGKVRIGFPGGCNIGVRPIDLHLNILKKMGIDIYIEDKFINASIKKKIKSGTFVFDMVTVTGTENILMTSIFVNGEIIIKNAACEPEIVDLSKFLTELGAKIYGIGTNTLMIKGVKYLHGNYKYYSIISDRIEAGTYLIAGIITKGRLLIDNINPNILSSILFVIKKSGVNLNIGKNSIEVNMNKITSLNSVNIVTATYPFFPTDMQPQFIILNIIANGISLIIETVFKNRFTHIKELISMGAKIILNKNKILIIGNKKLLGTFVKASDLRSAASLILAGLIAVGKTIIEYIDYIDRGYDNIENKLTLLGADIKRRNIII
ncbi:UDP-N-acetylglucosamine 1-carboxyvinyltransferase [Candidatus Legionella polyplacis]|uniref:UDP-N-acetylglucosamine 1-carboxyvinyltransferase n=1 Tax=Candidatus Legionella polyplacis TaxID=2005262 RepID=UPI000C1E4698|nr:UDP-N-acetylglucosamine 1-carboxyvinyltransferase [Candidatus Legionella polyplacis]ATW01686.1 UDP-N-acetylglucosamine 1-carboxyvinyltransferase [Candidatus Legionella polyplacis]